MWTLTPRWEGEIPGESSPSTYERLPVARAEADLASAKAGLAEADVNLTRDKALFANKLFRGRFPSKAK